MIGEVCVSLICIILLLLAFYYFHTMFTRGEKKIHEELDTLIERDRKFIQRMREKMGE